MKIASIIVTFNGTRFIRKCLDSLPEPSSNHLIIIIDNASTDNIAEIIKLEYPAVQFVSNKRNAGFGQANNQGLKIGLDWGADFFLLLNQDASFIQPNHVFELANRLQENKQYGVLSPMHLNSDRTSFDHGFIHHLTKHGDTENILFDALNTGAKSIYPVTFVNAACWLLTRKCIEKVGGFSPLFFHYGEDDNYVNRVHYHGFKVGISPEYFICHDRKENPISISGQLFFRLFMIELADINKEHRATKVASLKKLFRNLLTEVILLKWGRAAHSISVFFRILVTSIHQERSEMIKGGFNY